MNRSIDSAHRWLAICLFVIAPSILAQDNGRNLRETGPLTPTERANAIAITADARQQIKVNATIRTSSDQLVHNVARYPATDDSDRRRLASVASFDYNTGQGTVAVVDLDSSSLLRAHEVPSEAIAPTDDEIKAARVLLGSASPEFQALFQTPESHYTLGAFVSTPPADRRGHRVLLIRPVLFRGAVQTYRSAIVDLTTNEVLRYED